MLLFLLGHGRKCSNMIRQIGFQQKLHLIIHTLIAWTSRNSEVASNAPICSNIHILVLRTFSVLKNIIFLVIWSLHCNLVDFHILLLWSSFSKGLFYGQVSCSSNAMRKKVFFFADHKVQIQCSTEHWKVYRLLNV